MADYEGYVVYGKKNNKRQAFGVISNNSECKAVSKRIPPNLKRIIVEIEDKRFYQHHGIDIHGIIRASIQNFKAKKIVQGGSTITQQLSRNMLRVNNKTLYRKIRESIKALELENQYSKDEILDLYFNNVYWGKNIIGLRSASLHYFGKEIHYLTQEESLTLLTILRGPNYYLKNKDKLAFRYNLLNSILLERKNITNKRHKKNLDKFPLLQNNPIQILRKEVIPFITESIEDKECVIKSTIDNNLQALINKIINSSNQPISIVSIQNGKIIAFGSKFGTDYPFITKANVGSTLKPFIYCFLRKNGVLNEKYSSYTNKLDWTVREATAVKPYLTIQEALLVSNNNVFINSCEKVGMDVCLDYLSEILNKNREYFYPSSILGATECGISLYELAIAYNNFFKCKSLDSYKIECLDILKLNAKSKLGFNINNVFLKTGTTNDNQERYAILGNPDRVFAILRNEKYNSDTEKEGSFVKQISDFASLVLNTRKNYKWI